METWFFLIWVLSNLLLTDLCCHHKPGTFKTHTHNNDNNHQTCILKTKTLFIPYYFPNYSNCDFVNLQYSVFWVDALWVRRGYVNTLGSQVCRGIVVDGTWRENGLVNLNFTLPHSEYHPTSVHLFL